MTPHEIEQKIVEHIRAGTQYQKIGDDIGIKKGKLWFHVTRLIKHNVIRRVGNGKYEIVNGGHVPMLTQRKYTPRKPKLAIVPREEKQEAPPATPPPQKQDDIEEIATQLLGKIGVLQPLLLLHKDLFEEIERITLKLTERIVEAKPRMLSEEELLEYRELKSLKSRAVQIVEKQNLKRKSL